MNDSGGNTMNDYGNKYVVGAMAVLMILLAPSIIIAGAAEETGAAEVMEITWMMRPQFGSETTWFIGELEEKLGVKIIPNGVSPNDSEKVPIMLSAGEFPDAGYVHSLPKELYREGVIRGIPKGMIRQHMPSYSRMLDTEYPIGWSLDTNPDNENEVLTIQGVQAFTDTGLFYLNFRNDWAANVGMNLPDYDRIKRSLDRFDRVYYYEKDLTLDWFEDLLVAFKNGDPDGNGKIDTIPFGAFNSKGWSWAPIAGAFGVSFRYHHNLMEEGELTYWSISQGYKDFLKLLARWYEMGLIDKEFASLDRTKAYAKTVNGLVGAVAANINYPGMFYAMNRPPNSMVPDDELGTGAESVIIPPVVGPAGHFGTGAYEAYAGIGTRNGFKVNSEVNDEKLAVILQILDYMIYGEDENWIMSQFGQPGVHFDWEGEPWNSTPLPKKESEITADPKDGYFGTYYPDGSTTNRIRFTHPKHMAEFYQQYLLAPPGQRYAIRTHRYDILSETNLSQVLLDHGETLNTLTDEFFLQGILGQIDIDAEWDAYVRRWRNNGGSLLLAELAKAPLVSEARNGRIGY